MKQDRLRKWKGRLLGTIVVVLATLLALQLISKQWHGQQFFITQVQGPLVELQGVIEHQQKNGWDEPQIVSNQLQKVLVALEYGLQSYHPPHIAMSQVDYRTLQALARYLRSLPNHRTYSTATWDESAIRQANDLHAALTTAHLKLRTTISNDWDAFMEKAAVLVDELASSSWDSQ
ncbi:hypothetical protein ACFP56_18580 [Paenibacillus septentrionalis]|uniref:Uncharacterized protein n=1 Tax=Paenibacillus septentrionalis TaxID=429342 RepID=A0ABW1V8R9_9BACL